MFIYAVVYEWRGGQAGASWVWQGSTRVPGAPRRRGARLLLARQRPVDGEARVALAGHGRQVGHDAGHPGAQQVHGRGQRALPGHVHVPGQAGELPLRHHPQF